MEFMLWLWRKLGGVLWRIGLGCCFNVWFFGGVFLAYEKNVVMARAGRELGFKGGFKICDFGSFDQRFE